MRHLSQKSCVPELEAVAYADLVEEKAEQFYKKFGGKYYTGDSRRIIEDQGIEGVLILTNPDSHVPLSIEAIKAGKHVFVEKPLGINIEEDLEFREVLKHHPDQKFMIGFCYRYSPVYEKVKSVISHPVFSFVHAMSTGEPPGESYLRDNLCHPLDMLCWLHDSRPVRLDTGGDRC